MAFSDVPRGPPDPMFILKKAADEDSSPSKIDVGIGVYRSEKPAYHEFAAITKAKKVLEDANLGHEYNPTTGISSFLSGATSLLFGQSNALIKEQKIATVQTVGGTGAVRLGAAFLNRNFPTHSPSARLPNPTQVYVGIPTWPNYIPLFEHAGFKINTFNHFDRTKGAINMNAVLDAISSAPPHSIFVFQVCCHNPTGQDYSYEQWLQLADAVQGRKHFVFFDIAYQGFASDMDADAWPIRYFAERQIDLLACQSFSKHMGLYAERVGALHVVCQSAGVAVNVQDQLRSLVRWEVSSTPAYGARLADIVMHDPELNALWLSEVRQACDRMIHVRQRLYDLLKQQNTPGSWDHVLQEKGLFSYTNLDKTQIEALQTRHHVFLAGSGRINIAGLNTENVERFAQAIHAVVVGEESGSSSRSGPEASVQARSML